MVIRLVRTHEQLPALLPLMQKLAFVALSGDSLTGDFYQHEMEDEGKGRNRRKKEGVNIAQQT